MLLHITHFGGSVGELHKDCLSWQVCERCRQIAEMGMVYKLSFSRINEINPDLSILLHIFNDGTMPLAIHFSATEFTT